MTTLKQNTAWAFRHYPAITCGILIEADEQIAHNSSIKIIIVTVYSFSEMQELNLGYECQWRYHNYSILNYDPHPFGEFFSFHFALNPFSLSIWSLNRKYLSSFIALLKMGDYYYYHSPGTQEDSLSLAEQAISMYSRAALAGSPQVTDLLQL